MVEVFYGTYCLHIISQLSISLLVGLSNHNELSRPKESPNRHWQAQISSGFDALIGFASSELDRSKEHRRRSGEGEGRGHQGATPGMVMGSGASTIKMVSRVLESSEMRAHLEREAACNGPDNNNSGARTNSPQVTLGSSAGSTELRTTLSRSSATSKASSSPQRKSRSRSRSSSVESHASKSSHGSRRDAVLHAQQRQNSGHSRSRSRSPSPHGRDSSTDSPNADKYSKYDRHFKKKFFGKDYNFKQNTQPEKDARRGKFKPKGKDWEHNHSRPDSKEARATPPSSSQDSSHSGMGSGRSSTPSQGPSPGPDKPPTSSAAISPRSTTVSKAESVARSVPNSRPSQPHGPHFSLNGPPGMSRLPHPVHEGGLLRQVGEMPPSSIADMQRPPMVSFGQPPMLGEGPRGMPPGSSLGPPHLQAMLPPGVDTLHGGGPRFDLARMPMFSDLAANRPGFMGPMPGHPGFRPGMMGEMRPGMPHLGPRPPFGPEAGLNGPPRLFGSLRTGKDKTWKGSPGGSTGTNRHWVAPGDL